MKIRTIRKIQALAKLFIWSALLATFVMMTATFIIGWLSPTKSVIITMNSMGEMPLEIALVAISWACLIIWGTKAIRDDYQEREFIEEYRQDKLNREEELMKSIRNYINDFTNEGK
jgi:hypothetical protein